MVIYDRLDLGLHYHSGHFGSSLGKIEVEMRLSLRRFWTELRRKVDGALEHLHSSLYSLLDHPRLISIPGVHLISFILVNPNIRSPRSIAHDRDRTAV